MAIKIGTEDSDNIQGTSSADTIHGKGGDDRLYGLAGADTLYGGLGYDILIGGAGKDTLTGGEGADIFHYEARSDSRGTAVDLIKDFTISDGDQVNLFNLGEATLESKYYPLFSGLQAVFTYNATTNVTTLSYYQGSSTPVFQLKFTGEVHYDSNAFIGISVSQSPTQGDDQVVGTASGDTIDLLGGDDTYNFSGTGAGGDDSIAGGSGDDQIFGGDGHDTLRGGSGNDYISGGSDNDILYGGTGNDSVFGDLGNDVLYGGDGNDIISGDQGDDFVSGNSGNDQLVASSGNDTLNGGQGYDTVLARTSTFSSFSIHKNADGSVTLTDINGASDGQDEGTDTLINVEAIEFNDGTYIIATNTFIPEDSII